MSVGTTKQGAIDISGEPICPIHTWVKLEHRPDDDIAQWVCPTCGWMATEDFIENMTKERFEAIKKSHEDLIKYQREAPIRMQEQKMKARELKERLAKEERTRQVEKAYRSIMDCTNEKKPKHGGN